MPQEEEERQAVQLQAPVLLQAEPPTQGIIPELKMSTIVHPEQI